MQGRCSPLNDTAYTWASGTSMAVPHAAGLAAIYLAGATMAPRNILLFNLPGTGARLPVVLLTVLLIASIPTCPNVITK